MFCQREKGSLMQLVLAELCELKAFETMLALPFGRQMLGRNSILAEILDFFRWGYLTEGAVSAMLTLLLASEPEFAVDVAATATMTLFRDERISSANWTKMEARPAPPPPPHTHTHNLSRFRSMPFSWRSYLGNKFILDSIFGIAAQLGDTDLHMLVCSGGKVNILQLIVQMTYEDSKCLNALKMAFSRKKQLGIFDSLLYQENSEYLTVLEELFVKRFWQSAAFLYRNGCSPVSPLHRSKGAPKSIVHALLLVRWTDELAEQKKTTKTKNKTKKTKKQKQKKPKTKTKKLTACLCSPSKSMRVFRTIDVLLTHLVWKLKKFCSTRESSSTPDFFATKVYSSTILSYLVCAHSTPVLQRYLKQASEEDKNAALFHTFSDRYTCVFHPPPPPPPLPSKKNHV